ncbi:MAG: beta-galactosidase [Candidatus Aminicenantes bacterium]|nr:beta-galactosidase [Candidatus Aminicenantes bacterium]
MPQRRRLPAPLAIPLLASLIAVLLAGGAACRTETSREPAPTAGEASTIPPPRAAAGDAQRFFPKSDLMTLGVYYYPEHWPEAQWDRDFAKMAEMGFAFTHFAEFSWAFLEPQEGRFEFGWLDRAIGLAAKHGLKVVLGTPTAAPPAWMAERHPGILLVSADGRRREHGGRADGSLADAEFRQYAWKIASAMADRYGRDDRVWGWQIDNEPGAPDDYSPSARTAFQAWLKTRFGTIDKLNQAWGVAFWSLHYDRFEQVVIPNVSLFAEDKTSPHAVLDFRRFTADAQADFLDRQAAIIRAKARPGQWITTNYTNVTQNADPRRTQQLDFASFTMYPVRGRDELGPDGFRLGSPHRMAMACDYYRPISGVTGVMELQPGQVNWASINPQPMPGAIRMWLWHAFAGGSSFACTYRFRHPTFGSELYHDGIVGPDGVTPSRGGLEFAQVASEMKRLRALYDPAARMPDRLAARRTGFLWSHENLWDLENHKETALWDTWRHRFNYQAAVKSAGAPMDYIGERDDFSRYPFLVAPAYQLMDKPLAAKLKAYVEQGGHLLLSCRSGQKDKSGRLPESPWAGLIQPLIGAEIEFFDVLLENGRGRVEREGASYDWNAWADILRPDPGTEVEAKYTNQFYAGRAAAVSRRLGRGTVAYIGVETKDGRLEREIVRAMYRLAGTPIEDLPPGVYIEWRDGFFTAVNYSSSPAAIRPAAGSKILIGKAPLAPAEVLVWREK